MDERLEELYERLLAEKSEREDIRELAQEIGKELVKILIDSGILGRS